MSELTPLISFRPAQEEAFWCEDRHCALLWRRQFGKSRTLGAWGLKQMAEMAGCSVFYVSAAIALGVENIRKEAELWAYMLQAMRAAAEAQGQQLTSTGLDDHGESLDVDALADLFEHSKLETKLWHSRSIYSRSRVVAPNPATAVGWTGHIVLDEFGRIPDLQNVIEAVQPFMSSNPQFRWRWATTPPPQDDHYSWELLVPENEEFPVNPRGNWYTSKAGVRVHRVTCDDAFAGGTPMYSDKSGQPITPDESRAEHFDKQAWDRNYRLKFIRGGLAALSLQHLFAAMERGKHLGLAVDVKEAVVNA